MRYTLFLLVVGLVSSFDGLGQSPQPSSPATDSQTAPITREAIAQVPDLAILNTVKATYVNAGMWLSPLKCDAEGNLYLRNKIDGVDAIHKLNAQGKQIALFQPDLATPDFKAVVGGYFAVGKDRYVYELAAPWEDRKHHLFIYKPDGSLKSDVKLTTSFPWTPAQVAAFPSGNLLVTGLEYDHDRKNPVKWPFTGVFGPDGTLLKEVKLEDDDMIHDMAAVGDSRVVSPEAPDVNHAVTLGDIDAAQDGNVYLVRRLSPAILYAVSPGGEVVRRFEVDAGQPDYFPESMHIAGNGIALQFVHPQNGDQRIKIVDLQGHGLATYHDGQAPLGYVLACYTGSPDRFTFLGGGGTEDPGLTVFVAGPR